MNYTIIRKGDPTVMKASTLDEAKTIATDCKNQWAQCGVDADVRVYYRDGSLQFTA